MKARTKDRLRRFAKLKNHAARILDFGIPPFPFLPNNR
jgi:hypothetical protein